MTETAAKAAFPELSYIELLVQSGQKLVFRADSASGPAVLKLVNLGASDQRVEREIAAVSVLHSDYVPRILEHGRRVVGGQERFFIIEERVDGVSLRQHLSPLGRLDLHDVLPLAEALLGACVDFERARLVHRDIKPENLMVDRSGKLWVIDFGLVRMLELESLTATSDQFAACTPGYAAPEQFRNRKSEIDARADLFSVGVVLYEALNGSNPYRDGKRDALAVVRDVETRDLPRLDVPGDRAGHFSGFLGALCSRFPSRRPQSAAEAQAWFAEIKTLLGS